MTKETQQIPNILLVEDDMDLAEAIIVFFKQKNIKVIHYTEPQQALKNIESLDVEVVISDLNLPQMSGVELMKSLANNGVNLPVVIITASSDVEVACEAIAAGAYDFVIKPLKLPQLYIAVQRAMNLSKISADNVALKRAVEVTRGANPDGMIGFSPAFKKTYDLAKRVAKSNSTILISGESGTGKEIFAHAIHKWSNRKDKLFVAINCSAIPDNLLESELFGHAKGAFTGAYDKKIGLFEEAEGGTVFLDEIGDLNLQLQAKLLRVLQERKIKRIGENQMRNIDVRVITATHKDLKAEVLENRFREDLFFRLNVIPIRIPSLREREEDILPLAHFFLTKYNALNGTSVKEFTPEAKEFLLKNPWKGNVRELENTVERAIVLSPGPAIDVDSFLIFKEAEELTSEPAPAEAGKNFFSFSFDDKFLSLEEVEKKYIQYVFKKNGGVRINTAKALGIDRKTLYRKLEGMINDQGAP
ncbi:MAG: sigma-54-dependent Fis family transcriptional regulator [Pseudobdellovibrio sp.]|jgi:DNA-binding NtrC family response regulator|nr:sigma-54-dependent Fis family transcriptional regulator [Pseudobdellovibrio sp.]